MREGGEDPAVEQAKTAARNHERLRIADALEALSEKRHAQGGVFRREALALWEAAEMLRRELL